MTNFHLTRELGNEAIEKGYADLVSYGSLYICNYDLVEKFESGAVLNTLRFDDPKVFTHLYGGGPIGYTDLSVYEPTSL